VEIFYIEKKEKTFYSKKEIFEKILS